MSVKLLAFLVSLDFLGVLALLIGNTAAGLASRLAGSLAFTATALLGAQAAGFKRLDVRHGLNLRILRLLMYYNTK